MNSSCQDSTGHLKVIGSEPFPHARLSSADLPYFQSIPEWRRWSKTKSKHDIDLLRYERGRMMKIVSRLAIFFFINCLYIMTGACIFMKLEGRAETTRKIALYKEFIDDYHAHNVSRTQRDRLLQMYSIRCHMNTTTPWRFHHSLHLTYSIITTIGFGEIAPATVEGKIITFFYAIVGIFMFVLCLASTRLLVTLAINKVIRYITSHRTDIPKTRMIKVIFVLLLICFLWVTSAFFTFDSDEPMSWYNSWYNIFIAVTTIGFGDRVVLDDFHEYLQSHETFIPREILQAIYMINIIMILVLFSTLFEQLKQENVEEVSKRISHYINTFNQTHSKYVLVGPVLSAPGGMVTPGTQYGSALRPSLPTISELDSGNSDSVNSAAGGSEIQSSPRSSNGRSPKRTKSKTTKLKSKTTKRVREPIRGLQPIPIPKKPFIKSLLAVPYIGRTMPSLPSED